MLLIGNSFNITLTILLLCFDILSDVALWYEISPGDENKMVDVINKDLQALQLWADDNKTTFEHSKTYYMTFSNKKHKFDASRLVFEGKAVAKAVGSDAKVIGYMLDSKMTWGPMIDQLARKARGRLAALARIKHLLNSSNLQQIYCMFIRSIMEYGSLAWAGAGPVHLAKLDLIQDRAMRMCDFQVEELQLRKEAGIITFALKLMGGKARGVLKSHVPELYEPLMLSRKQTRQALKKKQIKSKINT